MLDGLDQRDAPAAVPLGATFRAVAWNIQRGMHLDRLIAAFRDEPELARADVLMLSEVDNGMGRSGNRHVAREVAEALGMGYAFAVSYIALEDDYGENEAGLASTLALAGNAILSRAPFVRAINADVPAVRDKFGSSEKRLGRKRAVVASLATEAGPITFAQAHLDSNADTKQRSMQLAAILRDAEALGHPVLLGGDLNTTTYQYSSTLRLARDLLHKLVVTGFAGTINNYLTPERRYESPMFAMLAERGYIVDGFNARGGGTIRYDFNEPYAIQKVENAVGGFVDAMADAAVEAVERCRRGAPRLVCRARAARELTASRAPRETGRVGSRSDRRRRRDFVARRSRSRAASRCQIASSHLACCTAAIAESSTENALRVQHTSIAPAPTHSYGFAHFRRRMHVSCCSNLRRTTMPRPETTRLRFNP